MHLGMIMSADPSLTAKLNQLRELLAHALDIGERTHMQGYEHVQPILEALRFMLVDTHQAGWMSFADCE
jgi:hypothetical protein